MTNRATRSTRPGKATGAAGPGVLVGTKFESRRALYEAGVHRMTQAGIAEVMTSTILATPK